MPTGPDDLARLEAVVDDAELDRLTTLICTLCSLELELTNPLYDMQLVRRIQDLIQQKHLT